MDGGHGRSRGRSPRQRLFATTKGRMLVLLCQGRRTVGELADHLGLTGNAVRAQLRRLQRDGMVRPAGTRLGVRKPHVDYELTERGRELFPRAYEPVLRKLVGGLTARLDADELRRLFTTVVRGLLLDHVGNSAAMDPRQRLSHIVASLGGPAAGIELERQPDGTVVRPCSCPLASVTASHPEVCRLLAGAIGEILGTDVRERCERGEAPRCCFHVSHDGDRAAAGAGAGGGARRRRQSL